MDNLLQLYNMVHINRGTWSLTRSVSISVRKANCPCGHMEVGAHKDESMTFSAVLSMTDNHSCVHAPRRGT